MTRGGARPGAGRKSNKSLGLEDLESISAKVTPGAKRYLEGKAEAEGLTVSGLIISGLAKRVRGFKKRNKHR